MEATIEGFGFVNIGIMEKTVETTIEGLAQ